MQRINLNCSACFLESQMTIHLDEENDTEGDEVMGSANKSRAVEAEEEDQTNSAFANRFQSDPVEKGQSIGIKMKTNLLDQAIDEDTIEF